MTTLSCRSTTLALAAGAALLSGALAACGGGAALPSAAPAGADAAKTGAARFDATPAGLLAPSDVSEVPAAANAFVDSVGVNVLLPGIAQSAIVPAEQFVSAAHLRHVRVAIVKNIAGYDTLVSQFAAASGAKVLGLTDCAPPLGPAQVDAIDAQDVEAFRTAMGGTLEAYEAVNEPDARSDKTWAANTKSCMQAQTGAGLPFLAPSIVDTVDDGPQLGNLDALVQDANIHRYFAGHDPDSHGWGSTFACGTYGALAWALCEAAVVAPGKPAYVTETGYDSVNEVDPATQAKYLLRALLVNFHAGVVRTYVYTLLGYTGSDGAGGNGLIDPSLTPKPSYEAISTALGLLNDPGTAVVPSSALSYSIAGPATLEHQLFERRDGSYVLALWNETPSWVPYTGGEIVVPAQTVTLTFPIVPLLPSATTIGDTGVGASTAVTATLTTLSLPIDDHVTFLRFGL